MQKEDYVDRKFRGILVEFEKWKKMTGPASARQHYPWNPPLCTGGPCSEKTPHTSPSA